ncbi:protein INCA1 [Sceloporus undulatus]|uniref:protein INCA1 n=1 Tax=Sceloporus undulatus TaxID=8520 RepID=UPI001C4B03AA|nr:protein INCA1 [Sceloporus undulatus]
MEGEKDASLMPFVKQSKMVSRLPPEAVAPNSDYSNREFWDWLSQQPSSCWMEEYREAPVLLTSGPVVQNDWVAMGRQPALFLADSGANAPEAPSPKELCRGKKKGLKRRSLRMSEPCQFCTSGELKRRQSSIDELKKATWGGCIPQSCCRGEDTADPLHEGPASPFFKPMPTLLYEECSFVDGRCNAQLLYPQWKPCAREQLEIPQESPVVSYTLATQKREPTAVALAACQPSQGEDEEDGFWGFELRSEE